MIPLVGDVWCGILDSGGMYSHLEPYPDILDYALVIDLELQSVVNEGTAK